MESGEAHDGCCGSHNKILQRHRIKAGRTLPGTHRQGHGWCAGEEPMKGTAQFLPIFGGLTDQDQK
jgi:hypothetical protein